MKKIICILLLLSIFTTALISCKGVTIIEDESESMITTTGEDALIEIDHSYDWQYDYDFNYDPGTVDGDYVFNNSDAKGYCLILKRNVATGECTTVCADPFCQHNSVSCPFYGTTDVVGIGNVMYGIMRDQTINKYVLYSYNIDTTVKETIYETTVIILELRQYKRYIYFKPSDKGLLRLNTETSEIEPVKPQYGYNLAMIRWDMLVWGMNINKETGEQVFVSTDLLGEDPRPYNPLIYKSKLHRNYDIKDTVYMSVAELSRNGEFVKYLVESCQFPIICGDKMLYMGVYAKGEEKKRDPLSAFQGTRYNNGDIFIMSLDTGESRLLCHIEEAEPYSWGMSSMYGTSWPICGDWISIITVPNYSIGTDKIGLLNDMILVNMKTGEYHISRYIE